VTDHFAVDDEHALYLTRQIIKNLNRQKTPQTTASLPDPPVHPLDDLYGIVGGNLKRSFDIREVILLLFVGLTCVTLLGLLKNVELSPS
jgi:3-methylcrotonyl-CoA carboxylase beta subunit